MRSFVIQRSPCKLSAQGADDNEVTGLSGLGQAGRFKLALHARYNDLFFPEAQRIPCLAAGLKIPPCTRPAVLRNATGGLQFLLMGSMTDQLATANENTASDLWFRVLGALRNKKP